MGISKLTTMLLTLLVGSTCFAFNITFNPGSYAGTYNVGTGAVSGLQTINLSQGSHTVQINSGNSFSIQVSNSGVVTSLNTTAATASGSSLTFNTVSVNIDPGSFTGTYSLTGAYQVVGSGYRTFNLIPNLQNYILLIAPGLSFRFDINTSGNVVSQNTVAASASGNTLIFNPVSIHVIPGQYTGKYYSRGVEPIRDSGIREFKVLPNLTSYLLDISPGANFRFDVDSSGNATSQNTAAAVGVGPALYLNTSKITIDPNAYSGTYSIGGVDEDKIAGIRTFNIIANLSSYTVTLSPGVAGSFNSSYPCLLSPTSLTISSHNFSLACDSNPTIVASNIDIAEFNYVYDPIHFEIENGFFSSTLGDFSLSDLLPRLSPESLRKNLDS